MRKDSRESGYAMLLVFAMAAIIAIGLYQQLPRAAFEAQRDKEQLLIDHGEQYKRAVQLFVRKLGRYPAKMEDLDNTGGARYLRKHYIDPMTGKEEWRLLHMGPAGKLIDSKIKPKDANNPNGEDTWNNQSVTEFKPNLGDGSSGDGSSQGVNIATRKRPSDEQQMAAPGASGGTAAPGADPNNPNGNPPPMPPTGYQTAQNQPGTPNSQKTPGVNSNSNMFSSSVSGNGGYGSSSVSGNGGFGSAPATPNLAPPGGFGNGAPVNSQFQGQSPTQTSPYSTAPGSNMANNSGFGNSGFGANGQAPNSAAGMIQNLLTTPRPGGAPTAAGGSGIAGGIAGGLAGVASTKKGKGIKRYADQDDYQKWEFFYDYGAEMAANAANAIAPMQQQPGNFGTPVGSSPAGSAPAGSSPTNSGFMSSFGSAFPGANTSSGTAAPPAPPPAPTQ